jgi:glycosyltransferase involved in cell wall biosynthesis
MMDQPILLVVESHPVQYRAPVYARLNQICPGSVHVVYASDFSLKGGYDSGFGGSLSWDSDLLAGYPSTIHSSNITAAPQGWNSLRGGGLRSLFQRIRPKAVLLTSLNYRYDHVAYLIALLNCVPIWIRTETQDNAFRRSGLKHYLRSAYYRLVYSCVSKAFAIGALNRQHLIRHGLQPAQLRTASYCTPDRVAGLSLEAREQRRSIQRERLGVAQDQLVISFFGKLIPKKNPALVFRALPFISGSLYPRLFVLFVGSGELQEPLESDARETYESFGVRSHFAGFVNQTQLTDWYLASDVLILPSNQAGETWGLVVNEAMQAGCAVIVSDAVGCAADFGGWQRFRVIPTNSPTHLASALEDLAVFPRSFTWASDALKSYSVEAVAQSLATAILELPAS